VTHPDEAETVPPAGTLERWAWDYVRAATLEAKLAPPPRPTRWEDSPPPRAGLRPGRPPELEPRARRPKTPRPGALVDPRKRAQLLHTFFHHELQAAELMCWAMLAFPDTPRAFRKGLTSIALDEVRHMALYAGHIERLGFAVGDFGVRDWFWDRVPSVAEPAAFVALLGIGFEGANLDHSARFAQLFRAVGDEEGARIQEQVGREEEPHVRFAVHWFERFAGGLEWERWRAHLPAPLSPIVMRGKRMVREARHRAGMGEAFLDALERFTP
jgi:uncharacterized ferritin-like protein (DUF455 family)